MFYAVGLFLCNLKTSGHLEFSNIFQGVYRETSAMKWANIIAEC